MTEQRSILLAVDLPTKLIELVPAIELAESAGWKVHLLHASAPAQVFVAYPDVVGVPTVEDREAELEREREHLTDLADELRAQGIDTEAHLIEGPTVEVILQNANALDVALIAIVGHKHGLTHRLVLGSVASALLKVATRPVLVLASGTDAEEAGLTSAIDRLINVIDRDDDSGEMSELRTAAEAQLEEPDSEEGRQVLGDRLHETVSRFETDHPSLTRAINDVAYYLSGMGI